MDAQDSAQQKLQDWMKGVDNNLQEVKVLRTWVQTLLCLRERNSTDFIPVGILPRELNVNWLSNLRENGMDKLPSNSRENIQKGCSNFLFPSQSLL